MSNSLIHLNLRLIGSVQGVGLRASAKAKADELGITGFVRNEPDSSVTMEAEGLKEAVERFVFWLEHEFDYYSSHKLIRTVGSVAGYDSFEIKFVKTLRRLKETSISKSPRSPNPFFAPKTK